MSRIPAERVRQVRSGPVRHEGSYVLYWMIGSRRLHHNYALQRALRWSRQLGKPLLIFEPISIGFAWSSERFVSFAVDGMREKRRRLENSGVSYLPWIETKRNLSRGLLSRLAAKACCVVTDDSCVFDLRGLVERASLHFTGRFEAVESDTLIPTAEQDRIFKTAASFRRWIHRRGAAALCEGPDASPLTSYSLGPAAVDRAALEPWAFRKSDAILDGRIPLDSLAIDTWVSPCVETPGGSLAAEERLQSFIGGSLNRYSRGKNHPDVDHGSRLAPYLHWGFISPHAVLKAVLQHEDWSPDRVNPERLARREGWWGLSPGAESFLDQLVTWRELGWNGARHDPDFGSWAGIPQWARSTLEHHVKDEREALYSCGVLEEAKTDDPIWNAAQTQLRRTGRVHSYLRMYWGKRVLSWTSDPEVAFDTLIHINNKFSLDGRDPNSTTGISWIFGRYDRAWGPERPVFGKVRFMSAANTRRKLRLNAYLEQYTSPHGVRAS
ncbi:MAG: deoxyribodipyrimidine photolyase [Rickettsiales bacterium]|nr:deoxyribodipyrimidine photolyase [Rickettsiales bacterium]